MKIEDAIVTLKDMKSYFNDRSHKRYSMPAIDLAILALEKYKYFANCMNCNCCDGEGGCEKFDIDVDDEYDGCTFYED